MILSAGVRALALALAVVLGPATGCSPEPTSVAHSAVAPAPLPTPGVDPVTPKTTVTATGACHVRADCPANQLCVYDQPGCDAPIGKCEPPSTIACAAALPIATCSGEPYHACAKGQSELPYYSRYDGKPGYAFEGEHAIASFYGSVARVVIYHAPDEILSDVAMTSERLESGASTEKRDATTADAALAATELLTTIVATRAPKPADLRWEMVLINRQGKVVASVGIDKFGDHGEINGQPVVFAHHGALAAMRALAAKMPGVSSSK